MLYLYEEQEKDFTHRGIGSLTDAYSCVITEHLNGIYDLILDYPLHGKLYEEIKPGRILKVKNVNGYQLFRIQKIIKDIDSSTIEANHIFYDLIGNYVLGCEIENKNGTNALIHLFKSLKEETDFKVSSTIETKNSVRFIRRGLLECFFDGEVSLISRWGGEFERDNFNIRWKPQIGEDRGVSIRYAKNLIGLEFTIDYSNIITTVMPQGYDGLTLPEKYVDSPIKDTFLSIPRVKEIQYPEIKSKKLTPEDQFSMEHEKALEKLREFAAKEFSQSNKDKPIINCTVDFVELSSTEEYKNYAVLERVYLGDTVHIQYLQQGVDFTARVCAYKWDVLNQKYTFIEVGQLGKNALTSIASLENKVHSALAGNSQLLQKIESVEQNATTQAKETVNQLINAGFGGHVRVSSDEIKIMDTDNELTAKRVWRWNLGGFAVSNTGVNGPWRSAMAEDGSFLADFISGLVIRGEMIESNSIRTEHLAIEAKEELINEFTNSNTVKELIVNTTADGITTTIRKYIDDNKEELKGKDGKDGVIASPTEPEDKTRGWIDTLSNQLKVYQNNEWVVVNNAREVTEYLSNRLIEIEGLITDKNDIELLKKEFESSKMSFENYRDLANGRLDALRNQYDTAIQKAENIEKIITQDQNGISISSPNSTIKTTFDNDGMAWYDNNVKVAFISNQRLFINSGVFVSELIIARHKFTTLENVKGTVMIYIGEGGI